MKEILTQIIIDFIDKELAIIKETEISKLRLTQVK